MQFDCSSLSPLNRLKLGFAAKATSMENDHVPLAMALIVMKLVRQDYSMNS
jgi:hypothetical protein